jgi:hypothetical protein
MIDCENLRLSWNIIYHSGTTLALVNATLIGTSVSRVIHKDSGDSIIYSMLSTYT